MFLYNVKLFILYSFIKSLQVVDGGSALENEPLNEPLKFIRFQNHLQSPNYVEQRSNTTTEFSNTTAQTQVPNNKRKSRIWVHTFQIPSDWSKYLPNNKNEEQRLNTRTGSRGNLTTWKYTDLGSRRQLNERAFNLPMINWFPSLHLWPGEKEAKRSSYIRYNRSELPKSDFRYIRKLSGINGSRLGMAELSGLEGDNTNTSNISLMSYENTTKPSEKGRQKPWIRCSPNYPGWSEDVPDYEYANKNSNTTMKSLTLHPQTKSIKQKNWFAFSPNLPVWSGNEPNFGNNQQSLHTRTQESHGSKEISEGPRVITGPIRVFKIVNYNSNKQNDESNIEMDQKPRIISGWNYPMSPETQFNSPHETRKVRGGEDVRSVYGQELFEVEENSDNDPSLPVFIPV